jgi:hypothetical protein
VKVRFKDRLQDELHGGLHNTLCYRRNAQRSGSPFGLGNLDHPDGGEAVAFRPQRFMKLLDHLRFLPCLHNLINRLAIHSRGSFVCLDLAPSLPQDIRPPDFVVQTVKPPLLVLLGCAIEGSLQVPDFLRAVPSR